MSARFNNTFFYSKQMGYTETPKAGTPFEKIIEPGWWAHVTAQMIVGQIIQVVPEDKAYFAELFILEVGPVWAKVAVIRKVDMVAVQDNKADIDVQWSGPHTKHRVKRGQEILKDGFLSKEEAWKWVNEEYLKAA